MPTLQDPIIDRTLRGHGDDITSVVFHPVPSDLAPRKQRLEQVQVASAASDGGLILWNYLYQPNGLSSSSSIDNEVRAFRFHGHNAEIHHLAYSPTGNLLASCSSDKTVRLWKPKRSGESTVLKGHKKAVRCVDFSHHDSLLVTCSDDKTLKLWNLPNKGFRCSMVGHNNWVRSCKFSPDSRFVMSGSDDGSLKLWDCSNGVDVLSYRFIASPSSSTSFEPAVSVRHVNFHPSGNILAASGSDGNVQVYDLRSDKVIHSILDANTSCTTTKQINSSPNLSFHPRGHLMTGNSDGTFKLFDVRSWKCVLSVTHSTEQSFCNNGGKTSNYCCNFSSDGSKLVTGGDKTILVWKANFEGSCYTSDINTNKQVEKGCQRTTKVECDVKSRLESNKGKTTIAPKRQCIVKGITVENDEHKSNRISDEYNDTKIREVLSGIIGHIVKQLDSITSTVVAIEKRLSVQEEALATLQNVKNK